MEPACRQKSPHFSLQEGYGQACRSTQDPMQLHWSYSLGKYIADSRARVTRHVVLDSFCDFYFEIGETWGILSMDCDTTGSGTKYSERLKTYA
jgi:hypothetical protein